MSEGPVGSAPSLRDRAVARSLDPARVRAEARVQRFLDAAVEVMAEAPEGELTVQEVVDRSGQSLRSFYQSFAGKHELLLAVLEEAIRATTERLAAVVDAAPGPADDGVADPLARLRTFVAELYATCRPGAPARGRRARRVPEAMVMAEFAQRLLTQHPKEAARAFTPLAELCTRLLDEAVAAGALRPGPDHRRTAGVVLQAVMFNAFSDVLSGTPPTGPPDAAPLWDLLLDGLRGGDGPGRSPTG